MAPKYSLYSGTTVDELLEKAGKPQDNAHYLAGEPPVSFFTQPPKGYAAVFSTMLGTRPFRFVKNPTYEREGYYWWAAEIQKTCDGLRRHMPDICRNIETPRDFWDLYRYFDAIDIYQRGAQNLWNVLMTLIYENDYAREVVEVEQKWQTEQHLPLFKVLAAKLLSKPDMQSALLQWDEGKQPDILKALAPRELQIFFKGYNKYPEHFLEAIRGVFRKHYDSLQKKGLPLALGLDSVDNPNINVKEGLNALRCHLDGAPDDPFMDKFDIPNKIVNGVVIADGTSQTAARKAGYNQLNIHSTNHPKRHEDAQANGPSRQRPESGVPAEDTNPSCQNVEQSQDAVDLATIKRCSSAPIGVKLSSNSTNFATNDPRIHTSNSHVADQKHTGHEKPIYPEGHIAANAAHTAAAYAPNSHLQEVPPAMHNGLPPPHYQPGVIEARYCQAPSVRQPAFPNPPVFVPNSVAPAQLPEYRDRGMSQGAFANQIPTYALSQQYMQGPPPIMQQAQGPAPVYTHAKKGGNNVNGIPPYAQTQHYNTPPVHTGNFRGSVEHKKNPDTKSNGKWQQVGSDDIHGPKAIFRKDSIRGQAHHNTSNDQWQSREPHHTDRRTSTTSATSGFRQFNNSRPQQYNNYDGLRPATLVSTMGNTYRSPATASQLLRDYGCVNADTQPSVYNKFDPCPCNKCNERDRTIYVIGFKDNVLKRADAKDHLNKHFSKFGQIEDVRIAEQNFIAVHIRFASPQSTIAAVRSEPEPVIEGLGDSPVTVNFRTGSQFFVPKIPRRMEEFGNYRHFTRDPAQAQPTVMPQPPIVASNNFNAQARPFQYHHQFPQKPVSTSGAVVPSEHHPGATIAAECAMSVLDRAATQSGFGKKEAERSSFSAATNLMLQPSQRLRPIDVPPSHSVPNQQPIEDSQLDGAPQDSVKDISNCTEETNTSSQTSIRGTPIRTPQSDNDTPLAVIPLVTGQDDLAQLPDNKDPTTPDEEMKFDYGTVRVRPGKAQYVPIPSDWRQNPTSPHCIQDEQQKPTTTEIVVAGSQPEIGENQSQLDNGKHTSEELESSSHAKRKASRSDDVEEASGQLSPKKKSAKTAQPGEAISDGQSSQSVIHKEPISGRTTTGKKKKKNKSKRRQSQNAGPACPENLPTDMPYETRTFQPAIATSNLPQYPEKIAQELESEKPEAMGTLSLVQMPPVSNNTMSNGNEPFPAYRDVMSGPQLPIRERQGNTSKWSLSSNESAVVEKLQGLNPVAQDFVPHRPITGAENQAFSINFLDSAIPSCIQSFHGESTQEGQNDCAPRLVNKEYDWGRSQSGSRSYGGKNRYKNKQGYKHRMSVNDQPPIGTPRAEPKPDAFTPIASKETITSKDVQLRADLQLKPLKQETSKEESNESRSVVEPQPKEVSITDTPKDIKVDRQDKGKGKEKEANSSEAKVQETVTTKTTPKNNKRIEPKISKRPELRPESRPSKSTNTTSTVHTSTPSSATVTATTTSTTTTTANPKPKQGKSKNRTAPKKGVGTHSQAETKGQPLQASKRRELPSNSTSRKPTLSLDNADDFPALPSKPAPVLAPIPLVALPRPNAWQKTGRSTSSTTVTTTKAKDEGKSKDEGQSEVVDMVNDKGKEKEKAPSPFPKGERKGG
ncbi:hypothetical protein F5B22DRAFT_318599 [Xylaria bambusicola]|uniref:uncharacterized protein n=1 Tax=Xylaria bambusicola TaxID=326684 RepID=UPI002008B728|nr:uncharacterized protein F5B22DRAFT_318599 [Xylaria bambusicola]KAI0509608.1 hypothetical protein F5B22DRAFT_318599 [Xylaria bambusicola]